MFTFPTILYPTRDKALDAMNTAIHYRRIVPIGGPIGVGKTHLLNYLAQSAITAVAPDQVIRIALYESESTSFGKPRLASPITLIAYSELYRALQWQALPVYVQANRDWKEMPKQLYSDPQFLSIQTEIANHLRRLQICVLIIDNAQWIDTKLIAHLVHLRDLLEDNLAVILGVRIGTDETVDQVIGRPLSHVESAHHLRVPAIELTAMTPQEFWEDVLPATLNALNVSFTQDLAADTTTLAKRCWTWSHGNWYRLHTVAMLCDEEVARDPQRRLSHEILDRIDVRMRKLHVDEPTNKL